MAGGWQKGLDYASVLRTCRAHSALAMTTLAEICMDKDAPAPSRVAAATALLDRAWGKPTQALELSGRDGGAIEITQRQRTDFYAAIAARPGGVDALKLLAEASAIATTENGPTEAD